MLSAMGPFRGPFPAPERSSTGTPSFLCQTSQQNYLEEGVSACGIEYTVAAEPLLRLQVLVRADGAPDV